MTKQTIKIKLRELLAANVCTSTETRRYYLMGVSVRGDGKQLFIEGCDGMRLVRFIREYSGEPFAWILDRKKLAEIKVAASDDPLVTLWQETPSTLHLQFDNGGTVILPLVDGTFPDTDRVIPAENEESSLHSIGVNPLFVADFAKINKILQKPKASIIMTFGSHHGDPIRVTPKTDDLDYLGVIMPVRL